MGRRSTGWKLRQRGKGRTYTVRFWIDGVESERSTGTSKPDLAAREAARIYAQEVARGPKKRKRIAFAATYSLEEIIAAWLASLVATHAPGTIETWRMYAGTHWLEFFDSTHSLTDPKCAEYMRARLLEVTGETVRKELTALRQFLKWAFESGHIGTLPKVPSVPKRAIGTSYGVRRRAAAIELSPEECSEIISLLPQWSESKKVDKFPIRARFIVAYETSLRPGTLDQLEAGVHYRVGAASITLTAGLDKNRWQREVPLSARAREALDSVCPESGPIFGKHDYREHLKAAADRVLAQSPERAKRFCGAHLRSARITHWLERTANLPGTQYLAGHKLAVTTSRYVRPSLRAALEVLKSEAPRQKPKRARKRA